MAVTIGQRSETENSREVLARARARAALIPDLLIDAHTIANTVTAGWHGRRKRGSGDTFWQFRPYDTGESMARIDWRRSARDDTGIFVRDQEWESAHTVWVWADSSSSMLYKSELGHVSKQSRALVLALAAGDVLARSGERVGWPGVTRAVASRNGAERIAAQLMAAKEMPEFPPLQDVRNRSELLLVSDFLAPMDETLERLSTIARRGVRGTLLQIIDPAEERFPFTGRTRFEDPSSGAKLTFGRAETLRDDYTRIFAARKQALSDHCRRLGWHHVVHHTDELASTALVAVHTRLTLPSFVGAAA
ncbi:DUF58 domain-containing protein [Ahrensia sp. R2A130]|uniref:DUF58 domain-containing protein n=1 Tax=Ahrensia sp. R2A130 TaxID=744979 RepID=UPI0001E0F8AC|nr:DUF58 domain-containing protein [Ahrensia sp. R2A130]EFL89049.1 hypothetical protein R2A130_1537 [Ahrensia sp. R2A130]